MKPKAADNAFTLSYGKNKRLDQKLEQSIRSAGSTDRDGTDTKTNQAERNKMKSFYDSKVK